MDRSPIKIQSVTLTYDKDTPLAHKAVDDVSFELTPGSLTMLVGPTGSGKSSVLSLIDGLKRPTKGKILMGEKQVHPTSTDKELSEWRSKIGFVFQFPESQLFASTVLDDIKFGPMNQGMSEEKATQRAKRALHTVGLTPDLATHSPFTLSGGQQRRVALAGVLAMDYQLLLMDEPLSGLDPDGKHYLSKLLLHLRHYGKTVLIITHDMQLATLADRVLVMNRGQIKANLTPQELFANSRLLAENDLVLPSAVKMTEELKEHGVKVDKTPLTIDALADELTPLLKGSKEDE